jgi:hypothetical protein
MQEVSVHEAVQRLEVECTIFIVKCESISVPAWTGL